MLGIFSRVFSQKENAPSWYFHPSFFRFYEDACGKMRHKVSERGNSSNQTWSDVTSKPVMPGHCNGHITSDRDSTRPQSSLCIETRNYLSPWEGLEDFVRFTWFSGGTEGGGDICRWRSIKRGVGRGSLEYQRALWVGSGEFYCDTTKILHVMKEIITFHLHFKVLTAILHLKDKTKNKIKEYLV